MPRFDGEPQAETLWRLTERVKELTALHATARITQDDRQDPHALLTRVVALLPPAWQYPAITEARLTFRDLEATTAGWRATPWRLVSRFDVAGAGAGQVEVCYTEPRPEEAEGPFLAEERSLIDSIAEMLRAWFHHRHADDALDAIRRDLESRVQERTAELARMSNALFLTGERERRAIAEALHDHVGQSLAFARMRLLDIGGNAVFCSFEGDIAQVVRLIDGAIRYTRDLTTELSPPRLYELGLDAALEGLADRFRTHHKLPCTYEGDDRARPMDTEHRVIVYAAARELLSNAVKHARARSVRMTLRASGGLVRLTVEDDGVGFDPSSPSTGFGLSSVRERLRTRGGRLSLRASPGAGTLALVEIPLTGGGPTGRT